MLHRLRRPQQSPRHELEARRRRRRRSALLRARVAHGVRRIFKTAWDPVAQYLPDAGDLEFMQRLREVRAKTDRLIGREEEVLTVAAAVAEAAEAEIPDSDADGVVASGPPRTYLEELLQTRYGIVAHDVCARPVEGGAWVLPVEAWVYRQNEGRHMVRLALCQKLLCELKHGITDVDAAAQRRYEERGRLIFRSIAFRGGESGHQLEARVGGQGLWRPLPQATDSRGRVRAELTIPAPEAASLLAAAGTGAGAGSPGAGLVPLELRCGLPGATLVQASARLDVERGLSCISDVDDTIKITEVFRGKDQIVKNTFFEEFRAVSGMATLFQAWARQVPGMSFHFVSNSPPELLEPLRDFLRDEGFPRAPLYLRPLVGKERSNFKVKTIETILCEFPSRQFILIGDSGERDAAIYADLMRRYPQQVIKVLIREVHPSRLVDEQVFVGLDPSRWQAFRKPSELDFPIAGLGRGVAL